MNVRQTPKLKKQVRTKRVCSHPNPLFEKWLQEWKTEAEKRGSNMKYNFQRAINSLRKYPLPLHSGKDCIILTHFGDKICKLIDKKIEEYTRENGIINWEDIIKVNDVRKKKASTRGRKRTAPASTKDNRSTEQEGNIPLSQNEKPTRGKKYVPAYRSGAYALLIALDSAESSLNSAGFLGKQELMKSAQKFCDTSFTVPVDGTYYTAWSSMSTLIKKNLVARVGNPSRYSLTPDGSELASLLASTPPSSGKIGSPSVSGDTKCPLISQGSCSSKSSEGELITVHDISSSSDEDDEIIHPEGGSKQNIGNNIDEISLLDDDDDDDLVCDANSDEGFMPLSKRVLKTNSTSSQEENVKETTGFAFVYVTLEGMDTPLKEKATVSIDEDRGTLLFLIKANLISLLKSGLDYKLENDRDAPPGYTYAYLSDTCAPEISPGFGQRLLSPTKLSVEENDTPLYASTDDEQRKLSKPVQKRTKMSRGEGKNRTKGLKSLSSPNRDEGKENKEEEDVCVISALPPVCAIPPIPQRLPVIAAHEGFTSTLLPGSFEIILNMDNAEVTGGHSGARGNTREILKKELDKYGVDIQVRNLKVGDFLWTCRGRDSSTGEETELVLPFVVERKRMDDLSSSILDGRFKEQKFRLKQSGLGCPIYLVEEFGSSHTMMPLASCLQAITNTQIIDGFTVKVTKDQKESAAYLTIMTRYLRDKFKDKTLRCVPHGSPTLSGSDWSSSVLHLMSLKELHSSSAKNRPLRLQEMLAKNLLQIFGASVDKVTAITQKYQTPSALTKALEQTPSSERENLLRELKCPKSGRAIDQSLSTHIARLYTWQTLQ